MTNLQDVLLSIQGWWFDLEWQGSPLRRENVREKLAAHDLAMKEGRESPYTHPEKYDFL